MTHRNTPLAAMIPLLLIALCAAPLRGEAPATQPAQRRTPATEYAPREAPATQPARRETPIVQVHGSSAEMGAQHARRLAAAIDLLHEKYLKVFLGSAAHRMLAMVAAKAFEKTFSPEHLAEVKALALQAGMNPEEAVLAQCFLDLTPMSACSTITLPADAAPDHVARFGRNLDFPALNIADKYTTVFVYRPDDGRYQFASVGWPGMIGVLSGMNEHGLALANMEVTRGTRLPEAMPYTLLYRTVLERCKTVDEAIDLLRKTPRQTPNNLMLMDAAGHRAVVEISPERIAVRHGVQRTGLISTNHQRGDDADSAGRCKRYDFLHDRSKEAFGQIDEAELQKMLAGASQGNFTLQAMIFEPANRVIYLSAGKNAARGTFQRIELNKYFEGPAR